MNKVVLLYFRKWYNAIALVFTLIACNVCVAQNGNTKIPETKSGKMLLQWLEVFAKGTQKEYEHFFTKNYSEALLEKGYGAENIADRQARKYVDAKGYIVKRIAVSTDSQTVVLAQANQTGLWFRLSLKVEGTESSKIVEYSAQRIPPPVLYQQLTAQQLSTEVAMFMDKLVVEDGFSGSLLIAKDDKIIFQNSYGYANKAYAAKNNNYTKYNLASIGKIFTAIAINQLVEQGKLALTDTLGKFIPNYPNKEVSSQVTVHHLLTHTSGLGDIHGEEYVCKKNTLREVHDYFTLFQNDSLDFAPGTECQYSNVGYILLGAIIENVSGENYFDYIRSHIFVPCGMSNTEFCEADLDITNRATGYTNFKDLGDDNFQFEIGTRRNTNLYNIAKGNPQGGVYSTLNDLLLFTIALKTNKLVSAETYKLMTTNKTFFRKYDASEVYYGYGFELEVENGKRVIGHGGGDLGISTALRLYPDSGNYTVIVLSNYDRGGILTIYKIQEWLTQYK